jgi:glycosyl hydrolase family 18 (putative chitinase)
MFGQRRAGPTVRQNRAGSAEAFLFNESTSVAVGAITVYVSAASTSNIIVAGLYTDRSGKPRSLLVSGSRSVPRSGRWVTVPIKRTSLARARSYWIAVLGKGGTLDTGAPPTASCKGVTERMGRLSTLPRVWADGARVRHCVSAYVSGWQITKGTFSGAGPGNSRPTGGPPSSGGATGRSPGGSTTTLNTPSPTPPRDTALPSISGTPQQGSLLTASPGTWTSSPTSYAFQWQDCSSASTCVRIQQATGSSYIPQPSDIGRTIDVVVTAANAGGSSQVTSAQTEPIQALPPSLPVNTAAPTVSGTAQQWQTLTANNGSWSNSPTSYTYQWQDCSSSTNCSNIFGATAPTYTLESSDVGKLVDLVVTASNAAGSVADTSMQTSVIASSGFHQMFANYLAWSNDLGSDLPWNAMTQVVMFALKTTNGTALDASTNEVNHYNLPSWTAMVHSHDIAGTNTPEAAFISIGGSNDSDWQYACDSTNQAGFVSNLVSFAVENGFDGIDIDAETGTGTAAQFESCVQAIATAGHAATTEEGKPLVIAEEMDESLYNSMPYSTIQHDISYLDQVQLEYFGYNPYSDWNCSTGTPANTCAYVSQMVSHATSQGIPADKLLLGMATYSPYAAGSYSNLGTTTSAIDTTSGTPTSIPVSSISSAVSAGDIVLATTENPPAHYEVFTTSGAATCSSSCSIPITGVAYGNGGYAFPSGSYVQSAYAGPWDCYNMGEYVDSHGLEGNMIFDLQDDQNGHGGSFACSDQLALGLGL